MATDCLSDAFRVLRRRWFSHASAVSTDELFIPGLSGLRPTAPYDIYVGSVLSRDSVRARNRPLNPVQLDGRTRAFAQSPAGCDLLRVTDDRRGSARGMGRRKYCGT